MPSHVILSDFDGTIAEQDVLRGIFEEFASHEWKDYLKSYNEGEIGAQELYRGIFPLIKVSKEELKYFVVNNFSIDPGFKSLINYCREEKIPLYVISDGLDFYIDILFENYGIKNITYYSNKLNINGNSLSVEFPYSNTDCDLCGNCKRNIFKEHKKHVSKGIYIGDGYSDRCVAKEADFLLAKSVLIDYCKKEKISFLPFSNFCDVLAISKKIINP